MHYSGENVRNRKKKKNALQMYKAKASKVLLLMFLSDLVRVNNASSFKDEVSSTDLLLFSFSLVLIPVVFFLTKYICIHTYFGDKVNNRKHIWNTNWKTFKKTKIKDVGSDLTPSKWVCWWCWCTSVMLSTLFINNSIFPKYMQF